MGRILKQNICAAMNPFMAVIRRERVPDGTYQTRSQESVPDSLNVSGKPDLYHDIIRFLTKRQ